MTATNSNGAAEAPVERGVRHASLEGSVRSAVAVSLYRTPQLGTVAPPVPPPSALERAVTAEQAVTPVRAVSTALYDLILRAEQHRVALAHDLELGTTDVAALWEIARTPGQRPGDLARALGLGVAGTSSVVDKLVNAGLVRRQPDPTDRRSLNLSLTPAGRHAHAWIAEQLDHVVTAASPGVEPTAAATTAATLRQLADGFINS